MRKLGITDASFLYFERDGAPMNIGSLQRFEKAQPNMNLVAFEQRLTRYLERRVHGVDFMTRKLKWTPFDLDQPVWVTDPNFNIRNHVYRTALSTPGTDKQLANLVARLHEKPLNRNRPLWEMYLIDGLEDGTFALYSKYHHAALDGMSAQRILDLLYTDSPDQFPKILPRTKADTAGATDLVFDALLNLSLQPFEQLARLGESIRSLSRLNERFSNDSLGAMAQRAPLTPFNVRVSDYRSYATTSLPLHDMYAVGKQCGASLNDVLLAVCGHGLRRYLQRKGQLPETPLLAGIPVSLRAPGDHGFKNHVTMLRASLETQIDDPLERLRAINQSTREGKATLKDARSLIPEDLHVPGLASLVQGATAVAGRLPWTQSVEPASNVVISNVPGPRKTKYLLGARMLTHHPVSIAADGNAVNITVQSYGDRLDLGITACLEVMPDVDDLKADILEGWQALQAAQKPPRRSAVA